MKSSEADREAIKRANGLYVGLLRPDEIESLNRCEADGYAKRSYEGTGGFLGLAKVMVIEPVSLS